ncbi:hypothetical protein ACHMW6_00210 (plasmid) [Pseudoduganella sp. UC29_106]|uniref:hypothetical protein n=1 Tax=Pseudoduganella sp. UC29_106 TaxID=3374553 RepID=UPI003757F793
MAIREKQSQLSFSVKIPRDLHDKIDEVREAAKKLGVVYDPSGVVARALERDVTSSLKQLESIKQKNSSKGT